MASFCGVEGEFLEGGNVGFAEDGGVAHREEVGHYHVDEEGLEGAEKIEVAD